MHAYSMHRFTPSSSNQRSAICRRTLAAIEENRAHIQACIGQPGKFDWVNWGVFSEHPLSFLSNKRYYIWNSFFNALLEVVLGQKEDCRTAQSLDCFVVCCVVCSTLLNEQANTPSWSRSVYSIMSSESVQASSSTSSILRRRRRGFLVCPHNCRPKPCESRNNGILWPKEGNSLPRHSRSKGRHPRCNASCPAYNNSNIVSREPTSDELTEHLLTLDEEEYQPEIGTPMEIDEGRDSTHSLHSFL